MAAVHREHQVVARRPVRAGSAGRGGRSGRSRARLRNGRGPPVHPVADVPVAEAGAVHATRSAEAGVRQHAGQDHVGGGGAADVAGADDGDRDTGRDAAPAGSAGRARSSPAGSVLVDDDVDEPGDQRDDDRAERPPSRSRSRGSRCRATSAIQPVSISIRALMTSRNRPRVSTMSGIERTLTTGSTNGGSPAQDQRDQQQRQDLLLDLGRPRGSVRRTRCRRAARRPPPARRRW